jgi:hypothetical protein
MNDFCKIIVATYSLRANTAAGHVGRFRVRARRYPNAGITSRANRSTECRASSTVMSPKASQGTK